MKHEMIGERRKSRFDPHLAERIEAWDRELTIKEEAEKRRMELEARLRREREDRLKPKAAKPAEEAKPSGEAKPFAASGYALMDRANTYALGAHALMDVCDSAHPTFTMKDGSCIYRPLTFEENIRARLEDYNTLENPDGSKRSDDERKRLFCDSFDSCTGIAYKKWSTLFKIIIQSEDLIDIEKGFNDACLPVNYSQPQGIELDSSKGKYNQYLTLDDVINHPAWNEAVTNKPLLNEYANLVFRLRNGNNMRFWVRQNTLADELRALCVNYINGNSDAGGNISLNLDLGSRFVRATHRAPQAPLGAKYLKHFF